MFVYIKCLEECLAHSVCPTHNCHHVSHQILTCLFIYSLPTELWAEMVFLFGVFSGLRMVASTQQALTKYSCIADWELPLHLAWILLRAPFLVSLLPTSISPDHFAPLPKTVSWLLLHKWRVHTPRPFALQLFPPCVDILVSCSCSAPCSHLPQPACSPGSSLLQPGSCILFWV